MVNIVGVRLRIACKIYYFSPSGYNLKAGDKVVEETARGLEYGTVALSPRDIEDDKIVQPLMPIIRLASEADAQTYEINKIAEKEALPICAELINKHGLDMKLVNSEYTLDKKKLLFYYTAPVYIDFRELVTDLAAVFKTRIELRQIGVRDETKITGGIGVCGRPLCCNSFMSEFKPVYINMAKEQNVSLNASKISGVCGRLMCCLRNESDVYEELNSKLPNVGDFVSTYDNLLGQVQSINVLKQLIKVKVTLNNDEKEIREYKVEDIIFRPHKKKEKHITIDDEIKALELLEKKGKETLCN